MKQLAIGLLARESAWAARRLLRTPRFAAVAVLTMGLAAAPSLIFSLVSRAVLPALPFENPAEMLHVWRREGTLRGATSYPKLRYLQEHSRTLDVAAATGGVLFLEQADQSLRLDVDAVTPTYFDVFGLRPRLGRAFRADENLRVFEHPVVILSESLWRRRFGERPNVIGETVRLSGEAYRIVGVMKAVPLYFHGHIRDCEAWIPAMMSPRGMLAKQWRESAWTIERSDAGIWLGSARLRAGHSFDEARAEAAALGREVRSLWPKSANTEAFDLIPMSEDALNPQIVHAVSMLRVAGALVLILGGLNLLSLFLTRGLKRSTALAVHAALGAPRLVLVWGAAFEAWLIGTAGALTAIALARGSLSLLGMVEPSILVAPFGVTLEPAAFWVDGSQFAMSLALSVTTALAGGVVSALRVTRGGSMNLRTRGQGVLAGGLRGLRLTRPAGVVIAVEITLALTLTLPALLLTRSLGNLVENDIGFRPDSVAMAVLDLPISTHPEASVPTFVGDAVHEMKTAAGVRNASWISNVPFDGRSLSLGVKPVGRATPEVVALSLVAASGAFDTLGIPLKNGRDFGADDRADGPRVAVLSQEAVRQLGVTGVGSRVETQGRSVEVVGIVGDVPYQDLANKPLPAIYFPLTQSPRTQGVLVVRSERSLHEVATLLGRTVKALDSRLETPLVTSLAERVAADLARFRGAAWLLGAASLLALLLSAIGIYGHLSAVVARALPEIGLRIALGARPSEIVSSIATSTTRLAVIGLIMGCGLGALGARYLKPYLFGVAPWDIQSLGLSLIVAALLALGGAMLPAHRAGRVDPVVVLKHE